MLGTYLPIYLQNIVMRQCVQALLYKSDLHLTKTKKLTYKQVPVTHYCIYLHETALKNISAFKSES